MQSICYQSFIPVPHLHCRFGARLSLAYDYAQPTCVHAGHAHAADCGLAHGVVGFVVRAITMHTLLIAASLMVSWDSLYAQCPLAPQPTAAWVVLQSGDVSMMKDTSGYRKPLVPCSFVSQQQVIKTGPDGYAKFQVSDGSTFEVFPNSEVTFRKTYGIGDLLNVWMGKVKVYIQHLPGIPNPNNVTTPTALISVRGTI